MKHPKVSKATPRGGGRLRPVSRGSDPGVRFLVENPWVSPGPRPVFTFRCLPGFFVVLGPLRIPPLQHPRPAHAPRFRFHSFEDGSPGRGRTMQKKSTRLGCPGPLAVVGAGRLCIGTRSRGGHGAVRTHAWRLCLRCRRAGASKAGHPLPFLPPVSGGGQRAQGGRSDWPQTIDLNPTGGATPSRCFR
jgi:hypothetical protein